MILIEAVAGSLPTLALAWLFRSMMRRKATELSANIISVMLAALVGFVIWSFGAGTGGFWLRVENILSFSQLPVIAGSALVALVVSIIWTSVGGTMKPKRQRLVLVLLGRLFVGGALAFSLAALDQELDEMSRSFGRERWRSFALIVVPGLLPFAAATLRIMFGVAWKVTLTAELFGGSSGLGYLINLARQEYDTDTIFTVIVFIIIAVYLADRFIFLPLERYTARQFGGQGAR